MKRTICFIALAAIAGAFAFAKGAKTYQHALQYQVAILDRNLRVTTGSDVTVANGQTDAKLGDGGQGIHLLYTDKGNYRVESPVNKGRTVASGLAAGMANMNRPGWAKEHGYTIHNKWFLDNVQPGSKVLFADGCEPPNKKHPNETVKCTLWFPDPDSTDHEYETTGDFTPYLKGDGSNTQKVADTLCGTGKLRPEVEAQICGK